MRSYGRIVSFAFVSASVAAAGCTIEDGVITEADVEFEEQAMVASASLETPDELVVAARRVSALAAESTDDITGARLETGAIVVALPDGDDVVERERHIRDELAGDVAVRFERVANSRADMDAVREDLRQRIESGELGEEIAAVGEDPSRGVVVVYAHEGTEELRKQLKEEYGSAVIFRRGNAFEFTSRTLDIAPHWGGAGYGVRKGSSMKTPWCSTAFPVNLDGRKFMLTAGHCIGAYWDTYYFPYGFIDAWAEDYRGIDKKYWFGKRVMSTYAPWMKDHGDFALLEGSTYENRVYESATTAVAVSEVDWGMPSVNEQFCFSGRTSGKRCRQIVVDPDIMANVCHPDTGTCSLTGKLVAFVSDQDLNGVADCKIPRPGDSGGAIFQWAGSKFRAMGIITGGSVGNPDTCRDDVGVYTRLQGVRSAYPTMTMPLIR